MLHQKIRDKSAKICVIGLGNVGLPLACVLADVGFSVTGLDVRKDLVEAINKGQHHLGPEPGMPELMKKVAGKKLRATTEKSTIAQSDIIIVSVPLFVKDGKPDFSIIESAFSDMALQLKGAKDEKLVIIETTVPVGTTERLAKELESKTKKKLGKDLFVAHSSERIQTGRILKQLRGLPKTLAGLDGHTTKLVDELYSNITKTIPISSVKTEEAVKIFEGVYRDVNIALANELALFCEKAGIDVHEAISAANTQPFCHLHEPGVGVSGYCIPVYPWFIIDEAKKLGIDTKLLEQSRHINNSMPEHVLKKLEQQLKKHGRQLKDAKIAVLGLTFKPNSPGTYHTMPELFVKLLQKHTNHIVGYDPYVKTPSELPYKIELAGSINDALKNKDAVVIMTEHDEFKHIKFSGPIVRKGNMFS